MRRLQGIFKLNGAIVNPKTVPKQCIRESWDQVMSLGGSENAIKRKSSAYPAHECACNARQTTQQGWQALAQGATNPAFGA
jgi:hypothetical protein